MFAKKPPVYPKTIVFPRKMYQLPFEIPEHESIVVLKTNSEFRIFHQYDKSEYVVGKFDAENMIFILYDRSRFSKLDIRCFDSWRYAEIVKKEPEESEEEKDGDVYAATWKFSGIY